MNKVIDVTRSSNVRIAPKLLRPSVTASSSNPSRQILFWIQRLVLILFFSIWQSERTSIAIGQELIRSSLPVPIISNVAFVVIEDAKNGKAVEVETENVDPKPIDDQKKTLPDLDDQAIKVANDRVRVALQDMTEVTFEQAPLRECLDYLEDLHGIEVELDPVAAKKLGDLDSLSISLTANAMSLADALMIMLSPFDLSYLADEGKLIITTHDEVRRRGAAVPMKFSEILIAKSTF